MSFPSVTASPVAHETKSRRILKRSAKWLGVTTIAALLLAVLYYSIQTYRARSAFLELSQTQIVPEKDIPLAGQWIGHWDSKGVGDGGELKAIITRDPLTSQWRAQFFANHYAIFETNQELILSPQLVSPGRWTFEGTAHLTEGDHSYTAAFDGITLTMTWKSMTDHGVLILTKTPATLHAESVKSF